MLQKSALTLILILSLSSFAIASGPPSVIIEINGESNYAYLDLGDSVHITVTIDPRDFMGQYVDVWLSATTPSELYWYVNGQGWVRSDKPLLAMDGPLSPVLGFSVMKRADLPSARYSFQLSIDNNDDGILDSTFSQSIDLFIDSSPFLNFRNCRACHEHPETFPVKAIYIPDRHHMMVQTKGFECKNCHHVVGTIDSLSVEKITDCRGCHEHPETFPVKAIYIPDRHHILVQTNDFECLDCHRLRDIPTL